MGAGGKRVPFGGGRPRVAPHQPRRAPGWSGHGGASQFGLEPEQGLAVARQAAESSGVELLGLHAYFGSQRLKTAPIVDTVRVVGDLIEVFAREGLGPRVVDIGLGVGVPYLADDEEPDLPALQAALREEWERDAWSGIELWSEAGRALVARSGYFVARVTDTKELHGKGFVFLDGGLGVHNPGVGLGRFFRKNPGFAFVPAGGRLDGPDRRGRHRRQSLHFGRLPRAAGAGTAPGGGRPGRHPQRGRLLSDDRSVGIQQPGSLQ